VCDRLFALDCGLRVAVREQERGERPRIVGGSRRELAGAGGMEERLDSLVDDGAGEPDRAAEGREPRAAVEARTGRDAGIRLGPVGERHHHAREGDSVGDAVMDPHQDRAPGSVVVDQVDLPQRPGAVERRTGAVADELLECRAVVRCGQRHVMEVDVRIEVRVVLPVRARQRQPV
jgi:hypothetical protein